MTMRTFTCVFFAAVIHAQIPSLNASSDPDRLIESGRSAYAKGEYAAARDSLEQAWALIQPSPASDPRRYEIARRLEAVLSAAGDYKKAQEYLQLAIDWREKMDPADPKLANDWIEMATLSQRLKDYPRALGLLEFVLAKHLRAQGGESLLVADDYSRIALVHSAEQKPELAIPVLQTAIRIREAVLGVEHPAILAEVDRLGAIYLMLRRYPEAEETFRRSLVIRERLAGPSSAELISSVEALAYAQFAQKEYDEAERGYRRLLALWQSSTGQPDHPMIALTLDKMAAFYRAQQRWREADDSAADAIAIRRTFLARGLKSEAAEQSARGNPKEAVRMLRSALTALDESRPEQGELRKQIEDDLKSLAVEMKPAPLPPAKSPPRKQPQ